MLSVFRAAVLGLTLFLSTAPRGHIIARFKTLSRLMLVLVGGFGRSAGYRNIEVGVGEER